MSKNKELLFHLLYEALITIREESYNIHNEKIFRLSNLLHNVPLMMNKRGLDEESCQEIIDFLTERLAENTLDKWFSRVKDKVEKKE